MRVSALLLVTLRDDPAEAEIPSHKLLLRGGYIRRVASGIYAYLPLMWRVLRKVSAIVRQEMDAEFGRFKAGQLKRVAIAQGNPTLWSKVRLMYSSVSVVDNKARLDVVLNAPEDILDQSFMNKVNQQMLKRAKDFGLDDLDVNISVIPNRVYKFDNQKMD